MRNVYRMLCVILLGISLVCFTGCSGSADSGAADSDAAEGSSAESASSMMSQEESQAAETAAAEVEETSEESEAAVLTAAGAPAQTESAQEESAESLVVEESAEESSAEPEPEPEPSIGVSTGTETELTINVKNGTEKEIVGISFGEPFGDYKGDNLLAEGVVLAAGSEMLMYFDPAAAGGDVDYNVYLVFEDGSESTLHSFPYTNVNEVNIVDSGAVIYIEYVALSSGEERSSEMSEYMIKYGGSDGGASDEGADPNAGCVGDDVPTY